MRTAARRCSSSNGSRSSPPSSKPGCRTRPSPRPGPARVRACPVSPTCDACTSGIPGHGGQARPRSADKGAGEMSTPSPMQTLSASVATADAHDESRSSTQLYGRSREMHALSAALRRAAAGGAELVVLSGPAGIGKTTLVRQIRTPLGQQQGYFISGKFDQLQRDVPFSAIVAALQDLVRQVLTESQAQQRAWRDAIVGAVGRNGRLITEVIPALERIVG